MGNGGILVPYRHALAVTEATPCGRDELGSIVPAARCNRRGYEGHIMASEPPQTFVFTVPSLTNSLLLLLSALLLAIAVVWHRYRHVLAELYDSQIGDKSASGVQPGKSLPRLADAPAVAAPIPTPPHPDHRTCFSRGAAAAWVCQLGRLARQATAAGAASWRRPARRSRHSSS